MTSNLFNLSLSQQHDTPIKKGKDLILLQQRTAESEQKVLPTLQSIEAEQLFERFQKVLKITEEVQVQFDDQSPISRKLEYEPSSARAKLEFTPKDSSMKKKQRICYKSKTKQQFEGIVLFSANEKENQVAKKETEEKNINEETKFSTPNAKQRERGELGNWATRKKVDRSD